MKQVAFEYLSQTQLSSNLDRVITWSSKNNLSNIWIQVYVMEESGDCIPIIADTIDLCMPGAKYMITHAGLAFVSGRNSDVPALVVCNVFEDPETKFELFQYDFTPDTYESTVDEIIKYVHDNPWIKLMSLNTGSNLEGIGHMNRMAQTIDQNIAISGGAAITRSLTMPAKVLSSDGQISTSDLIVAYIGGENFEARTDVIVGWKGIGKEFEITKSDGALVSEIDGEPAFNIYKKYFKMDTEPGLIVENTIEFPLCFEDEGILFLRCPLALNPDGSIVMMMNDLTEGKKVRLSFGSVDVIIDEVATKLNEVAEFEPQVISVNSCLGRLFFWGDDIQKELGLFQKIAPSSGYLTGGEILRKGGRMLIMNETVINTAMREGRKSPDGSRVRKIGHIVKDYSMAQRLATFIDTVTNDLEEYTKTIERMAITDELTGLYNRREIDRIILNMIGEKKTFSLIMGDADNFKIINDTYGHSEGDKALVLLSEAIKKAVSECDKKVYAGRWGGDEFLIAIEGDGDDALKLAQDIQNRYCVKGAFKDLDRTISIGIATNDTESDSAEIFQNVDEKLYEAKKCKGSIVR